jgi:5-methyltetrahydropteroyltriglutamate--homocysteine methyltransferase
VTADTYTTTFRADHVGSFLRPPEVLEARRKFDAGEIPESQLREVEDQAILRILQVQRDAGLGIFSDGEYRRTIYSGALNESLDGLMPGDEDAGVNTARWHGSNPEAAAEAIEEIRPMRLVAGARLEQRRRIAGHEAAFLKQHSPGPWKITLTPPNAGLLWKPGVSDKFYTSVAELQSQLTQMYRDEIAALIDDGASYIQFDSLGYVMRFGGQQVDQAAIERMVANDNALIDGLKQEGVTFGLHMCRGNNRGQWLSEATYEAAAEIAFPGLHVDRFLLEYDDERAGGFEPLRFVPKDKIVALGLISTKTPELEPQDLLIRRIEEASKYVPLQNLALTPQCGFASVMHGNPLTWDDQRRKLELLVDTARKIWG